MSLESQRSFLAQVFIALMTFTGLLWVCTVAFIIGWPWEKTDVWKPDFKVPAVCAKGEVCTIPYADLKTAKAEGKFTTLVLPDPAGEVQEEDNWVKWKKYTDQPWQVEVKISSWHFETTLRYRIEDEKPVLVAYKDVGAEALFYGIGVALFMLLGLYLRKLRN